MLAVLLLAAVAAIAGGITYFKIEVMIGSIPTIITATVALYGAFLATYNLIQASREKNPMLKAEVAYCNHWAVVPDPRRSEKVVTKLAARFLIHNRGDRSTTITGISTRLSWGTDPGWTIDSFPQSGRSVGAHSSSILEFLGDFNQEIRDEVVSVEFTIQHTHGKLEVSHFSARTSSHPAAEKIAPSEPHE